MVLKFQTGGKEMEEERRWRRRDGEKERERKKSAERDEKTWVKETEKRDEKTEKKRQNKRVSKTSGKQPICSVQKCKIFFSEKQREKYILIFWTEKM